MALITGRKGCLLDEFATHRLFLFEDICQEKMRSLERQPIGRHDNEQNAQRCWIEQMTEDRYQASDQDHPVE